MSVKYALLGLLCVIASCAALQAPSSNAIVGRSAVLTASAAGTMRLRGGGKKAAAPAKKANPLCSIVSSLLGLVVSPKGVVLAAGYAIYTHSKDWKSCSLFGKKEPEDTYKPKDGFLGLGCCGL